ncbi:MAG: hypothetical protein QOI99_1676 [Actinomycetota bacterium]|nr:hypothetical protein [Actinomycetota bacterium]
MRRPILARFSVALLLAGAPVVVPSLVAGSLGASAGAQPTTCPTTRDEVATVVVASPEAGATVSGRVEVMGHVEAPTALFQVELFVGDSRKDVAVFNPPTTAGDFVLGWDAGRAPGGTSNLRVVACGGSADGDSLISGTSTVEVQVEPSAAPAPTRALLDPATTARRDRGSRVAGAVIVVPGVASLLYALGRRRRA